MSMHDKSAPFEILLVDDDEGDVLLTQKVFKSQDYANSLNVVTDGVEAMEYLRQEGRFENSPRPQLILLDLNMPRRDGRETLADIKQDDCLKSIPVVVLTTSDADHDIRQSYELQASCFVTKPADLTEFIKVVQSLQEFWLCAVQFPDD